MMPSAIAAARVSGLEELSEWVALTAANGADRFELWSKVRGTEQQRAHVVVQTERLDDGRRRVVSIAELAGMEEDVITMQEIFRFRRRGRGPDGAVLGDYETTGVRPRFMDVLIARGIELPGINFAPPPLRRSF